VPADDDVRWAPTHAHLRAVTIAFASIAIAVLGRRPDIAVLGVPFLAAAAWGAYHRPGGQPRVGMTVSERTVFEGQTTAATVVIAPADADDPSASVSGDIVAIVLEADPWLRPRPRSGARAVASAGGSVEVGVDLRASRWGRHTVSLPRAACTSRLGAFRTVGLKAGPVVITTLPLSAEFDAGDAVPRPAGLVGLHRANRQGGGSEPAEIRPFRTGDRLRRINWRVSSRTGELHVTSTWSDRDTHVLLLLDTEADLGVSDGVDGRASSLDIAVRAAAAIAEHYLRAGDRVGLVDLGRRVRDVPVGGGRHHLRRLLDTLVVAEPGASHRAEPVRLRPVAAGALVVALTPLVGRLGQVQVARMVQHGHSVVVVDTMPEAASRPETAWEDLATRVRAMERQADIDHLNELGVPVVRWRGPGTLDEVLRDVSRLALAPRSR
jgi:uncharacterized protein (DUF58 family)